MSIKTKKIHTLSSFLSLSRIMRILHFLLILAVFGLLKNVYCDSSNPLPNASPNFQVLATNIQLDEDRRRPPAPRSPAPRPPTQRPPPPSPPAPPPPQPSKVTSYILAVQWPPGVCNGKDKSCKIPIVPTEFKIHGLWPQYLRNDPPTPKTFDFSQLGVLTTELGRSWPNLWSPQQQISVNLKFWEHEWNDHGRLSEMDGLDYFKKALALYTDVGQGLRAKLEAKGIKPVNAEFNDKTYKLADIEAAVKEINDNFSGTIICIQRKGNSNKQQIQEIRFRYSKDFRKQNNWISSNCGPDILFPSYTPSLGLTEVVSMPEIHHHPL